MKILEIIFRDKEVKRQTEHNNKMTFVMMIKLMEIQCKQMLAEESAKIIQGIARGSTHLFYSPICVARRCVARRCWLCCSAHFAELAILVIVGQQFVQIEDTT